MNSGQHYIFLILAGVGLCRLLMYGSIFDNVRTVLNKTFLKELINCSLCLGFWAGVVIAAFDFYLSGDLLVLLLPFTVSLFSALSEQIFDYFDNKNAR